MGRVSAKYQAFFIYLVLILATLIAFESVRYNDFIDFDDPDYVTENEHVRSGLTGKSIRWAFTTGHGSNWHPLTWLSHMLDCQLFGLDARWHHMTNLLLHIANTTLLFWLLKSMTGGLWQSFFVAGTFALHPLHVESVAWIAERKDVLSTLFWLLTMATYLRYVQIPGMGWYLLMLLFFALGLMAKPMLVTLPFVLLLLDYWPLGRFQKERKVLYRLVLEKVPLFVLSAISSVVTFLVEGKGTGISLDVLPLNVRIVNAVISYMMYIGKMIWPNRLAILYPYHTDTNLMLQVGFAGLILLVISICVIRMAPKHKYLLTGWLWYIGTLVPVIGLVQVGSQAMADRYTYVPSIGVFIMVSWGFTELLERWRYRKIILAISAGLVFIVLLICTRRQMRYWQSDFALFGHTLEVTEDNYIIHNELGYVLQSQGRFAEAVSHFHKVLQLKPNYAKAHNNLGLALQSQGKFEQALEHFRRALELRPDYAKAHNNLGMTLKLQGKVDEAISRYRKSLEIEPENANTHYNLALALRSQDKFDDAARQFRLALQIRPDDAKTLNELAVTLASQGRVIEAVEHFRRVLQIQPDHLSALKNMVWILATHPAPNVRDVDKSIELAEYAARLTDYQDVSVLNTLASAYAAASQFELAIKTAEAALELALADQNTKLVDYIRKRLERYKQAKP